MWPPLVKPAAMARLCAPPLQGMTANDKEKYRASDAYGQATLVLYLLSTRAT